MMAEKRGRVNHTTDQKVECMQNGTESETETPDDARTMKCEPVNNASEPFGLYEAVALCVMSTASASARRQNRGWSTLPGSYFHELWG